jgi:hypothetical protein
MYSMPVCIFMNREFPTIRELKGVSLQELGLTSGSAAIRLLYRNTDLTIESLDQELGDDGHSKGESISLVQNPISNSVSPTASKAPDEGKKQRNHSFPITQPAFAVSAQTDHLMPDVEADPNQEDLVSEIDVDVKIYRPAPDGLSQRSNFH